MTSQRVETQQRGCKRVGHMAEVATVLAMTLLVSALGIAVTVPANASTWREGVIAGQFIVEAGGNWHDDGSSVVMDHWDVHEQRQKWWSHWPAPALGGEVRTTIQTPGPLVGGPSKCLDADLNNPSRVQTYGCNGWDNQQWIVRTSPGAGEGDPVMTIASVKFGTFLAPPDRECAGCLPVLRSTVYFWSAA